ncbi:MAG: hypothetical protein CM15mP73_5140 [Hyphomicrobiales bacterium]|nr:MAG: hypothetical protein CM15mP73_5140 [Hyphomicrobiales bacterium]
MPPNWVQKHRFYIHSSNLQSLHILGLRANDYKVNIIIFGKILNLSKVRWVNIDTLTIFANTGLPGRANNWFLLGLLNKAIAMACSLPPLPMIKIFIYPQF